MWGVAGHVNTVEMARHFSPLVVAVASSGVRVGGECPSTASATSIGQGASEVFNFFLEAHVVLLELADGDGGWGECANLLRGVPESGLELRHRLLQLLDVGLSLCAVPSLSFGVTATLLRPLNTACRVS